MGYLAICSNPNCDYATTFSGGAGLSWILSKREDDSGSIDESSLLLPDDRCCELCGGSLLFYCPHCKKGTFTVPNVKHYRHCGKKIKPGKYDDLRATPTA